MKPIRIQFDNAEIRLISQLLDDADQFTALAKANPSLTAESQKYVGFIDKFLTSLFEELETRFHAKRRENSYTPSLKVHEAVILYAIFFASITESIAEQSLCRQILAKIEPELL
ncbi:MAG: hypothetical protein AAF206_26925 [Bacteroidota bacterium]